MLLFFSIYVYFLTHNITDDDNGHTLTKQPVFYSRNRMSTLTNLFIHGKNKNKQKKKTVFVNLRNNILVQ